MHELHLILFTVAVSVPRQGGGITIAVVLTLVVVGRRADARDGEPGPCAHASSKERGQAKRGASNRALAS